jgi:predicted transcriptional regulator
MRRFFLVSSPVTAQWYYVYDSVTKKGSREYEHSDAQELAEWLEDRETGYLLTHEKVSAIVLV